jgi:hypothetical protein
VSWTCLARPRHVFISPQESREWQAQGPPGTRSFGWTDFTMTENKDSLAAAKEVMCGLSRHGHDI